MLKLCGAVLILFACAAIGNGSARDIEARYEELCYVRRIILNLRGEMQYSRDTLSGVFTKLAAKTRHPYDAFFEAVSREMEARTGRRFDEIWSDQVERCLCAAPLSPARRAELSELGGHLGDADLTMQIRMIDLYLERLEQVAERARSEKENRKKVCRSMGLFGGMFLLILLF